MPVVDEDVGVIVAVEKVAQVTALQTTDLDAARIDLFTNDITPDEFTELTDLTIAAYTGYTQGTVTAWTDAETLSTGEVATLSTNVMSFTGPAAGSGPVAYGYVMRVKAPGTRIVRIARFPEGQSLEDDTKIVNVVAAYIM